MPEVTQAYAISCSDCGTVFAITDDIPGRTAQTMAVIQVFLRAGSTCKRMPIEEARAALRTPCNCSRTNKEPQVKSTQLSLF